MIKGGKDNKGFSLIEILVGLGIFVLFAVGIYSGAQFVFKSVYQSRLVIIETALLNEQAEIIRNMSFFDVGIINGNPAGLLDRTTQISRNGIDFTITRTIRNIDDPFDGTIGGTPNDTAPVDYKLVEIEISCDTCGQDLPVSIVTQVAPKYLEGDPTHGALFIQVFDAFGRPVSGADVHIVSSGVSPSVDFVDTTDNDGMLRLVDLAEGNEAYSVTVSKDGYTTDQTYDPTPENPNPIRPKATVVAQDVTEVNFSIDLVATLNIETIDSFCSIVPNVDLHIAGSKMIGSEPDVLLIDDDISTGVDGTLALSDYRWDTYDLNTGSYDILGSIPILPLDLLPSSTRSVQLILGTNTINSLLVKVVDSSSGEAVENANVNVTATGYDETEVTGVSYVRAVNWDGGTGQSKYYGGGDPNKFFKVSEDQFEGETVDYSGSGELCLADIDEGPDIEYFVTSGNYAKSSTYDLGQQVTLREVKWLPIDQPLKTAIRFQIATTNTEEIGDYDWTFVGATGEGSYYDLSFNDISDHESIRYMRYKAFLKTLSATQTPKINDIIITYTTGCNPPGQAYFGDLSVDDYTISVDADGYDSQQSVLNVDGDTSVTIELVSTS